jgi:hypothetical protein
MHQRFRLFFRFVLYGGLTLAAAVAFAACKAHQPEPAQRRAPAITLLSVTCEPDHAALNCRAIGDAAAEGNDPRETDMTDVAAWSTSNIKTVNIVRGRVTANAPGTATIAASVRSGSETLSSSVLVVVDGEGTAPQVAYDLKGVVRQVSNDGLANVELTLVDDQDRARSTASTGVDGAFRIVPLLGGQYRLRATKQGYRAVERPVNVPDPAPLTLVLLFDPK